MLPRKNRVKRKQFEALLKESFLRHIPYFSMRSKRNNASLPFSFAVVVSKKVIKTAVGRNLIKRRVRAIVEELHHARKEEWNTSIVLFLKKEGTTLSFKELKLQIQDVFRKI